MFSRLTLIGCLISGVFAFSCSTKETDETQEVLPYQMIASKSTAPIDLELHFVTPPKVGQKVTVECTVSPQLDAGHVELTLNFSSDCAVAGKCCFTQKDMLKGEKKTAQVDCTIPDKKIRKISATASIIEGDARLTKVVTLVVGVIKSEPNTMKGKLKKNERGENIYEFGGN